MAGLLIVDDDTEQLRIWELVLAASGHDIRTAVCVEDAVRLMAESAPDVLLMDLRLPRFEDGLALIDAATRHPSKIVVLSGWPDDLYGRPEETCVEQILLKPVRPAVLLETLRRLLALLVCALALTGAMRAETYRFTVRRPAEAVAEIEMSSPGSDWSQNGREAALADVSVDGNPAQNIMLYAGGTAFAYRAFLGALAAGPHELRVERNARFSAPNSALKVLKVRFEETAAGDPGWPVLAHAPILYARADTVGGFTDVPLLAYCERLVEDGKPLLQYTTIFSNEDGGTSTRALMARWGRTTDIEYIYRAWLNGSNEVERATIQASGHKEIEFRGRREGRHPVLIPSTRNNMVAAEGSSEIRYQLPPYQVELSAHAREQVMVEHPILWRVTAQEMAREGKIRPFGVVDGEKISDPRNYLYLEMKGANRGSALAALVRLRGETVWRSSHLGRADYAISRDGWVTTTIELPSGTPSEAVEEFGFECLVAPVKPEPVAGVCRLEAVPKIYGLDRDYQPGPGFWRLPGPVEVPTGIIRAFAAGAPARNRP